MTKNNIKYALQIIGFSLILSMLYIVNISKNIEGNITIFYIIALACILGIYYAKNSIFQISNPSSFFIVAYIFFICLAPIVNINYFSKVIGTSKIIALIILSLISYLIGDFFSDLIYKKNKNFKLKSLDNILNNTKVDKIINYIYAFGILVMVAFYLGIGNIPIFMENAEDMRAIVKQGKGSYIILSSVIFMMTTSYYIMQVFRKQTNNKTNILIYIKIIIPYMLLFGAGYRNPLAQLFLLNTITYYYIKYKKIKIKRLFIIITLLLFFLIGYSIFRYSGEVSISKLSTEMFTKILWMMFVNYSNVGMLVNLVDSHSLFYGRTYIKEFATLLPGQNENVGVMLKNMLGMNFSGEGVTLTILGESYINFSYIGVIIIFFILGLVFKSLYYRFNLKDEVSELDILFIIYMSISSLKIITGGLAVYLLYYVLPFLVIYLFTKVVSKQIIFKL